MKMLTVLISCAFSWQALSNCSFSVVNSSDSSITTTCTAGGGEDTIAYGTRSCNRVASGSRYFRVLYATNIPAEDRTYSSNENLNCMDDCPPETHRNVITVSGNGAAISYTQNCEGLYGNDDQIGYEY